MTEFNERRKALIVEDEPELLKMCSQMIDKLGFETYMALNPDDAFEQFNTIKPELVVSDLQMPGQSTAEELIKKIKAIDHEAIVFMVTSMPTIPDWAKPTDQKMIEDWAFSIGVDEFIEKPYTEQDFVDRMAKYERLKPDYHLAHD